MISYADHVEAMTSMGLPPMGTEEEWDAWKAQPATYRGNKDDMSLGHEHWTRAQGHVPAYEPGHGSDPGLFGGWSMR